MIKLKLPEQEREAKREEKSLLSHKKKSTEQLRTEGTMKVLGRFRAVGFVKLDKKSQLFEERNLKTWREEKQEM